MGGQFTGATFSSYSKKWLIGTGIFELLLAGMFLYLGSAVPEAKGGMRLTAGILGLTGVVLVIFGVAAGARAKNVNRVEATGLSGTGTIVGLTQTGMYMNNNPQVAMDLQVTVAGREPYVVKHKEFVPLILLGRLNQGGALPVKVDPQNPSNVVIEWNQPAVAPAAWGQAAPAETLGQVERALQHSGVAAAAPFQSAEQGGYDIQQIRAYLRANGLDGWATINQVQDSGQTVGTDHLFVVQTTVEVPGRAPYQTTASAAMVPAASVAKVYLGARVPVKVAAENPELVLFEWEKL